MTRTYKTEGIILKRTNFGEAERLLTIFTKHYGKIRVRAPGVRRTISRKSAHLELFNLSGLFLATGKNLDIVTEAQTINNFSGMRKNLDKVARAYYFCELADGLCPERQENREVFELLKQSLESLCNNVMLNLVQHPQEIPKQVRDDKELSETFANEILWILGYLPKDRKLNGGNLERFIENLLERKIKSKEFLAHL